MTFAIDTESFRKDQVHPLRYGYGSRGNARIQSIIVHSTNGNRGSSFDAEARYLRDSKVVSAHYLLGRDGRIAEILPPRLQAWHAGTVIGGYENSVSLGIELHHAVGDTYPRVQFDALTWLIERLMAEYDMSSSAIETHRAVARPKGRKVDPSDWDDSDFAAWRARLVATGVTRRYIVRHCAPILEARKPDAPIALDGEAGVMAGEVVAVDDVQQGWAHLSDHRGFVLMAVLQPE